MNEHPDRHSTHPDPHQALAGLYDRVRRRLRYRRLLEGATLALVALVTITLVAVAVMAAWRFDPAVVAGARWVVWLAAGLLGAAAVLVPLVRPLPERALARYLEARDPQLDALLMTATQAREALDRPGPDTSPVLARQLILRAVERCRQLLTGLEKTRLRRAGDWLSITLAVTLALALFGPLPLRHGLGLLAGPDRDPALGNPYTLQVAPGDVALLEGEDLRIHATPTHFAPEALELVSRSAPEQPWSRTLMTPGEGSFETFLFDLQGDLEYYVEAEGVRSEGYRIQVIPRPSVARIDLTYHFPPHTGRPPQRVQDGGEINAVRGTRVELTITPDQPVTGGQLRLDSRHDLPLEAADDGTLRATLELEQDGYYHVELPVQGRLVAASPEYAIATWADRLPSVNLVLPGRDQPATPVEEIGFRVQADDDVGVRELELVMSVNGGPDEVVPLVDGPSPATELTGRHTLYLEERALTPGDMIAYYVRARDQAGDPRRLVTTDMYFIDVRPFERHYRRQDGGGGGGGGGGRNESDLSAQQRSLVVALFKTARDEPRLASEDLTERLGTLAEAQVRIHERTQAIVRRLQARPVVELSKGYRRMAEELPKAASAMIRTTALLEARDVDQALPAAREALLYLQRADAAFRDVQVAQSQSQGGGGSASADDLANLFRLEMDRFRNPYADVQRGRQQDPQQQQIDETLRRLEELARRQQQEIDRAHRRAEQGQGSPASQQALAEELERMVRELERLTREKPDPQLADSLEQLRQAAEAMRQAAQGGSSGGGQAGAQALERLRQAQRMLERRDGARLAGEIGQALERSQSLLEEHRAIQDRRQADGPQAGQSTDRREQPSLAQRQRDLAEGVAELADRLPTLADAAAAQGQEAARDQLRQADRALRQGRLADRLERDGNPRSGNPGAGSERNAQGTERTLEGVRDRLASALEAVGGGNGSPQGQAREELRRVVRELEAMRGQLTDRARQGPAFGNGGWGGNLDGESLERLGENLEAQARRLAAAIDPLTGLPRQGEDIHALIDAIRQQARRPDSPNAQELARQYGRWLDTLKALERALGPGDEGQQQPGVVTTRRAEPGPDQRARVETYYRNLSEETGP